jgi:hypothetical protein
MRKLLRGIAGALLGVGFYWIFVLVKELRYLYWGHHYDWEGVFRECLFPFMSPALLSAETWHNDPLWANLQVLLSVVLIAGGATLALFANPKRTTKKRTP